MQLFHVVAAVALRPSWIIVGIEAASVQFVSERWEVEPSGCVTLAPPAATDLEVFSNSAIFDLIDLSHIGSNEDGIKSVLD